MAWGAETQLLAKVCGGEVLAHSKSVSDWNGLLSWLSLKIHQMCIHVGMEGGVRNVSLGHPEV